MLASSFRNDVTSDRFIDSVVSDNGLLQDIAAVYVRKCLGETTLSGRYEG